MDVVGLHRRNSLVYLRKLESLVPIQVTPKVAVQSKR